MPVKSLHDWGALKHFVHRETIKNFLVQVITALCLKTKKDDAEKKKSQNISFMLDCQKSVLVNGCH